MTTTAATPSSKRRPRLRKPWLLVVGVALIGLALFTCTFRVARLWTSTTPTASVSHRVMVHRGCVWVEWTPGPSPINPSTNPPPPVWNWQLDPAPPGPSYIRTSGTGTESVGIGVAVWLALTGGLFVLIAFLRDRRPGTCPECGYALEGLAPDAACPECGHRSIAARG